MLSLSSQATWLHNKRRIGSELWDEVCASRFWGRAMQLRCRGDEAGLLECDVIWGSDGCDRRSDVVLNCSMRLQMDDSTADDSSGCQSCDTLNFQNMYHGLCFQDEERSSCWQDTSNSYGQTGQYCCASAASHCCVADPLSVAGQSTDKDEGADNEMPVALVAGILACCTAFTAGLIGLVYQAYKPTLRETLSVVDSEESVSVENEESSGSVVHASVHSHPSKSSVSPFLPETTV